MKTLPEILKTVITITENLKTVKSFLLYTLSAIDSLLKMKPAMQHYIRQFSDLINNEPMVEDDIPLSEVDLFGDFETVVDDVEIIGDDDVVLDDLADLEELEVMPFCDLEAGTTVLSPEKTKDLLAKVRKMKNRKR
jgi:hypothetical protein